MAIVGRGLALNRQALGSIVAHGLTVRSPLEVLTNYALLTCVLPPLTEHGFHNPLPFGGSLTLKTTHSALHPLADADVYTVHSLAVLGVYNRIKR